MTPFRLNLLTETPSAYEGYGRFGIHMARALSRLGIGVHPLLTEQLKWDGFMQHLAGLDFSRLTVSLIVHAKFPGIPGRQWGYTMWECDKLPDEWAETINATCERLLVPCQWNADVFKAGGVDVPIHVIPGGIDPAEFPLLPDTGERCFAERPFTVMTLGDRGNRKGWDTAYQAFYQAFPKQPDVRLVIKCRKDGLMPKFIDKKGKVRSRSLIDFSQGDRRISIWRCDLDAMADTYTNIDCFCFPSRGEGYGLPPREAAAMGIPVITTNHGGMADDVQHWGIPVGYKEVESTMEPGAMWAQANVDEVAAKLRWVYENYQAARQQAAQAAQWIRSHGTWEVAARKLVSLLELHV